jgi:hypothetical protein
MEKLKLGTRVIVKGVETFISELHADITRGVYKVRTSNPTYEFSKSAKEAWVCCTEGKWIELKKAPKYGNYQVGDRVFCTYNGIGVVEGISDTADFPIRVLFEDKGTASYTLEGKCYYSDKSASLKKLRVKLGEKR